MITVTFPAIIMRRLAFAECERTIDRLMAGDRLDSIAHAFDVHPSTIYCLQECFIVLGVMNDRP